MGQYWSTNQHLIRELKLEFDDRFVTTSQYIASYRGYLLGVFAVLDELAADATESPTV